VGRRRRAGHRRARRARRALTEVSDRGVGGQHDDPDRVVAELAVGALRDAQAELVARGAAEQGRGVDRVEIADHRDHLADPLVGLAEPVHRLLDLRVRLVARPARRELAGERLRQPLQDRREHHGALGRELLAHRGGGGGRIERGLHPHEQLRDEHLVAPRVLVAEHDADAAVGRRARHQVGAMPGAVHQRVVRLAHAVGAREVLEHQRRLDAGGAHAIGDRAGRRRHVGHDVGPPHLLRVGARHLREPILPRQRREPGRDPIAIELGEQVALGGLLGGRGRLVARGGDRDRRGRPGRAPHRKVGQDGRAGGIRRADLDLLAAPALVARDLRGEAAGASGLELDLLGLAILARHDHLGIAIPGVEHAVDRDRAAGRHAARDRLGRHARLLQREHDRARAIGVAPRRPDAEPRRGTGPEHLDEPRSHLRDDRLGRVDRVPQHQQTRGRLDDAVALQRELDQRVVDDAVHRGDLGEIGARAEQPGIRLRRRQP